MKRTKQVNEVIHELYAILAKAAAQRAVKRVEIGDAEEADKWAVVAIKWMDKSSAHAIRWVYDRPRLGT
jgi:hypothetical protein